MRSAGAFLWLAVATASAQTVTTVPQFELPVGGQAGASVQSVSGTGASLIAPSLSLTPTLGLPSASRLSIAPKTSLQPTAAFLSPPVRALGVGPSGHRARGEALKTPAEGIVPLTPASEAPKVGDAKTQEALELILDDTAGIGKALTPVDGVQGGTEKAVVLGAQTFDGVAKKPAPVDLDAVEAEQGEAVVDLLLRDYPPDGHAFLGVGRSPAILVALLQNRGPGLARSLPLSDFYHHPGAHPKYYPPLTPELEARLFDHLDRFLPADALSGAKTLVLLDFVKGGRSTVALDLYLERYKARRHPDLRWTFFGLGLGEEHMGFKETGRSYRVLAPADLPGFAARSVLHTRMDFSWNKDWAEYGEFKAPFDDAAALEPRAEYAAWRRRLKRR